MNIFLRVSPQKKHRLAEKVVRARHRKRGRLYRNGSPPSMRRAEAEGVTTVPQGIQYGQETAGRKALCLKP